MVKIVFCDEDVTYINTLCDEIKKYLFDIEMSMECYTSGDKMMEDLSSNHLDDVDLLIMETDIEGVSGIDIKDNVALDWRVHRIVFLSNSDEKMQYAFGYKVMNFLLKRTGFDEILCDIEKIIIGINESKMIAYNDGNRNHLFNMMELLYVEVDREYTRLHFKDGTQSGLMHHNLPYWMNIFRNDLVVQIHRKYLVNVCYVSDMDNCNVYLQNGVKLPIGRTFIKDFKKKVKLYKDELSIK